AVRLFFFPSRSRHTIFSRDWRSDVCSSDLFDYVAILKTLGCTSGQIMSLYLIIQVLLLVTAIVIGSALGWAIHGLILQALGAVIPIELPPAGLTPFIIGSMTAVICLLSFARPEEH